jgi:hypothetical protein
VDRHPSDSNGKVGLDAPTAVQLLLKVYSASTGEVLPVQGGEVFTLWQE